MNPEDINGGAAFPGQPVGHFAGEPGMSLRDYFAAKAMQEVLSRMGKDLRDVEEHAEYVALLSYEVADAMLSVRERDVL
jgi:hypothetical protein